MTGRQAVLQLRFVSAVLRHERLHGRHPDGLGKRAGLLIDQAVVDLDGSDGGRAALAEARHELALISPA